MFIQIYEKCPKVQFFTVAHWALQQQAFVKILKLFRYCFGYLLEKDNRLNHYQSSFGVFSQSDEKGLAQDRNSLLAARMKHKNDKMSIAPMSCQPCNKVSM